MMMSIRKLLFLDNSCIVATGFEQIIYGHFNDDISIRSITGTVSKDALNNELKFDMIIIGNISEDTLEILQVIKQAHHSTCVVIFTGTVRYSDAMCFLLAGADGYLKQNAGSEEIVRAISTVLNGQRYLCRELLEAMAQEALDLHIQQKRFPRTEPQDFSVNLIHSLSNRQKQIVLGLMKGESVSSIAIQLGISSSTVGTHKAIAFEKLGVKSLTQLVDTYYAAFKAANVSENNYFPGKKTLLMSS